MKLVKRVFFIFAIPLLTGGCFTSADEILLRPPSSWSGRECQTVILSKISHNLSGEGVNVYAMATPYYPSVVAAINRMQAIEFHWDDTTAQIKMDALMKTGVGLYKDWEQEGKLVNSKGSYYRSPVEIDSLLFLVSLKNQSWPCTVPVVNVPVGALGSYGQQPVASIADWPCYIPDITDIETRILLVNNEGDTLRPKIVWGRRNNQLTLEEHLLVLFDFRRTHHSFLSDCRSFQLVLTGFDQKLELPFTVNSIE